MPTELKVPEVGESVTEVEIGRWLVKEGEAIKADQPLVELETDKVNQELPAPFDGALVKILMQAGDTASVGDVIAHLEKGAAGSAQAEPTSSGGSNKQEESKPEQPNADAEQSEASGTGSDKIMPAAQALLDKHGLSAADVTATGPGGRLLKEDVLKHIGSSSAPAKPASAGGSASATPAPQPTSDRDEEIIKMTPLRRTIAKALVNAQQTAALLTTFNEVDMTNVMAMRKQYQDQFVKKHGLKLGFMSFFVKAAIEGLKAFPAVNAEIRDEHIVYKNYYDIGIAIGGGKGLVVPVLRNAERLSFAGVEKAIGDYAVKAKENKLAMSDLTGGSFTITNGGVYGSLLSTPIVNPPQSGVLGMHGIVRRPIAVGEVGKETVEVRPMMYIALTYDHRIVDGREAVTFLKTIKEAIEDPARMLIEV
ncbi:MAG: 2-oxoglutarate dehydrogenase complex dihydrolipoyllysine-residue succinyltransferase [Phycisphaeraceae bacterium]|nr:2-oxoglutarate dehydrogenase complex dihydrolipoyllysine-residue succinyltransferase [Phycisphaeraceae bacterium]